MGIDNVTVSMQVRSSHDTQIATNMSLVAASTSEIYELLVSLLNKFPQTVEILPGDDSVWMHALGSADIESGSSFAPFLFVEGNLGIPQNVLYKVYLHAVGVFKSARRCVSTRATVTIQRKHDLDPSFIRTLAASSSILLLANPSHQTALNARKRLVQTDLIDPHAELRFTASLLSSQHCAKHAELWYHRQWLLSSACSTRALDPVRTDSHHHLQFTSQEALQGELELTSRACEIYPRNYFAWTHRLICLQSLLSDYLAGMDTVGFGLIFCEEIVAIKGWINSHVSDYSAIHVILALSQTALQSGDPSLKEIIIEENLLDHAISLVQEYPAHEALWVYIRTVVSLLDPHQQVQQVEWFVEQIVEPLVHLQHLGSGVVKDLVKASQYARQFLDRQVHHKFSEVEYT